MSATTEINEIKAAFDAADKGIKTTKEAMQLMKDLQDSVISWETFQETLSQLDQYKKDYSAEAGKIVGETTTLLLDSKDKYFMSTQSVAEWCDVARKLLTVYLKLFGDGYNADKAKAQKDILVKVLTDGVTKMTSAQSELAASSTSFNAAIGKIQALRSQLNNDFTKDSTYFNDCVSKIRKEAYGTSTVGLILGPIGLIITYSISAGVVEGKLIPDLEAHFAEVQKKFEDLQKIVQKAYSDLTASKEKLQKEIKNIGTIKTQTESTNFFVQYDDLMLDSLQEAATTLIGMCNAYITARDKKLNEANNKKEPEVPQ